MSPSLQLLAVVFGLDFDRVESLDLMSDFQLKEMASEQGYSDCDLRSRDQLVVFLAGKNREPI